MAKKNTKKTEVKDVEAIFNDMKDLALNKPKEEKKVASEQQLTQSEEKVFVENEENIFPDVEKTTVQTKVEDKVEITEEDLNFVDSVTKQEINIEEEKVEEKVVEQKQENNKRKTYEEMFGHTWMGYGFSN